MDKVATLGPPGTFSDRATALLTANLSQPVDVHYYPSIKSTFMALGQDTDHAVLPIENLSEGFVQIVLDLLLHADVQIVAEVLLPIQFSFISHHNDIKDLDTVYVQFVTRGQCSDFLQQFPDSAISTTESNMASFEHLQQKRGKTGAVVPRHAFECGHYSVEIENINDLHNNQTRFLLLSHQGNKQQKTPGIDYKTSLIIFPGNDRPGLLVDILTAFSERNINMTSIVSRPVGTTFGRYHFFIDIEGHQAEPMVQQALLEIQQQHQVKQLGSYPIAK